MMDKLTEGPLFLFSGAGNRFVLLDGRNRDLSDIHPQVSACCRRYGRGRPCRPRRRRPPDGRCRFEAPDGLHEADILQRGDKRWIIRLQMREVQDCQPTEGGYFLNTGARHFVCFVPDVEAVDVAARGRELRWSPAFAPEGANINFVAPRPDGSLDVRTFEKGVEAETLACGTGITASAIAWYQKTTAAQERPAAGPATTVVQTIHARIDTLQVLP